MGRRLLVPDEEVLQAGVVKLIVDWENHAARVAEYDIDTLALQ
jgi:hypothetical protein